MMLSLRAPSAVAPGRHRHRRRAFSGALVRAQAGEGGPTSAPPSPAQPAAPRAAAPGPRSGMPPPRPGPRTPPAPPGYIIGPDGQPLKLVQVENAGEEAWAGVAQLDRGEESQFDVGAAATLAAGDLAALLVFAVAGRVNHGEPLNADVISTALPFVLGWFATAPFLGGFGADASKKGVPSAAVTAAKCWAVGIPVGIVLRGLFRGYVPPVPFIAVGMAVNGALLVGWRSALAAATKPADPKAPRRDKRGNPFEFLSLLMSLTKRW